MLASGAGAGTQAWTHSNNIFKYTKHEDSNNVHNKKWVEQKYEIDQWTSCEPHSTRHTRQTSWQKINISSSPEKNQVCKQNES